MFDFLLFLGGEEFVLLYIVWSHGTRAGSWILEDGYDPMGTWGSGTYRHQAPGTEDSSMELFVSLGMISSEANRSLYDSPSAGLHPSI